MLLSKKPKTAKTAISTQKIVHISRARRPFDTVAKIEPLQVVNDLWADVAKSRLPILVESSIRADLDRGDHAKLVLRKVNYVLTKIDEAFGMDPRTQLSKTEMRNRMESGELSEDIRTRYETPDGRPDPVYEINRLVKVCAFEKSKNGDC
jgi:hypothetical protein